MHRVPTKPNFGESGSQLEVHPWLSNLWYLSLVDAWYEKPIIVYTRFSIFSLTRVFPITLFIPKCLMKSGKREARIVKADYGCVHLNTRTPYLYLTWYSTLNKGWLSSYFQITIPGWVIHLSLLPTKAFSAKIFH